MVNKFILLFLLIAFPFTGPAMAQEIGRSRLGQALKAHEILD